jgi:serine/threonine protein kinase
MGVVYEALHLPLGRRVALKVLPTTASLDPRQRERFQVEAQAAALLHHEHIVPVFGIGCDQGTHYYAMQYIDGRSMTDIIRALRLAAPSAELDETKTWDHTPTFEIGSSHLSPTRLTGSSFNNRQHCQMVAQLGLQAALALEHAHGIGVIHRDIKPSNLLIDARDHLWIADFGLARLLHENHELTQTGDLVGTLRYMSPEQVRGDCGVVDACADIYALGATLYELLTLRPAFEAGGRNELVRRILDKEPVHPRRFNPRIPRDLETIILKAMDKEPSARYRSAQALADDLKRFLDDQPIRARRPSLVDQTLKWSRRHRSVVVASTTALLVTLAASTSVLWEAKRRTDETLAMYQATRRNQQLAMQKGLSAIDQLARTLVAKSDLKTEEANKQSLFAAIAYYQDVAVLFSDDEGMQEVVAKACRQAGFAGLSLGLARGRDDYRRATAIYEKIARRLPDRIWYRTGLIETLHEYASLLTRPTDAAEADASVRRALEVADELVDNPDAGRHCFSMGLVGPFNDLAWDLARRPDTRASDAALAIRLARKAAEWEPERFAYWNTLGVAYYRAGDWAAAGQVLQRSIELSKGGTAADWFPLACVEYKYGQTDKARRSYDRAADCLHHSPPSDNNQAADLRSLRDEAIQVLELNAEQRTSAKSVAFSR